MDKTGIIVVSICVLLLGWWFVEQKKVAEQQAQYQATNQVQVAESPTNTGTSNSTPSTEPVNTATTSVPAFDTNAPEQTLVLTNGRASYTFTSRGGGLKEVSLLDYPETVSARWKGQITNSPSVAVLNAQVEVPVMAVLGGTNLVGDGNFTLTKTADGVQAEKDFANGLKLIKTFQFASNYLINASVRIENTSTNSFNVPAQEYVVGTATPMDADDNGFYEGVMWFDGSKPTEETLRWFSGKHFGCGKGTPRSEYREGAGNVYWVSAHNQYFALVAMTPTNAPAYQVVARPITLPFFQNAGATGNVKAPEGIQTALVYPAMTVSGNSSVDRNFVLFAGPKEYRTLVHIGEQYGNRADQVMNFGSGYIAFWGIGTFFAKLLLAAMNGIHSLTGMAYGWSIVVITILIKALFWPLTAKATRSMKKMQALAPELSALKEKYKDDQQKLMQKQMELYKKNKVNPMSGCFPMLIQMPVFLGFFTMIRCAIELRGAHWLWVSDLSKPDTLFMIHGITFLPFISTPEGLPFNLLPLLMGGAMLWQSHLQPPSPGMDPTQQKMMRWLPAIFILFLYNYSSGLALYWTVNNLLTIVQTKLTRTYINPTTAPAGPATNPALTPTSKKKK